MSGSRRPQRGHLTVGYGRFLLENDAAQIATSFQSREGGDQSFRARTSRLKNEWIREQCTRLGIPAVTARPWESSAARVISVLSAG